MAFHINRLNKKTIQNIDEHLKTQLEIESKKKKVKKEHTKSEFTKEEYLQMYDRKLFDKETPITEVKCRKCGKVKECTKTSNFYYYKVCSSCKRKVDAGKGVINL